MKSGYGNIEPSRDGAISFPNIDRIVVRGAIKKLIIARNLGGLHNNFSGTCNLKNILFYKISN